MAKDLTKSKKIPSKKPLVSVVMSVYNGEKFLREAIDSILDQTFKDFEFIIINDGSADDTLKIIKSYKDPRIVLISRKNKGLVASLNEGIEKAQGKYIARMDADDVSLPDRFQLQVEYLIKNPSCVVLSSYIDLVDELGKPLPNWFLERTAVTPEQIKGIMVQECCIAHPAVMMVKGGLPKPAYRSIPGAEDWDLWLRILRQGSVIHKIPKVLLKYRIHSNSITQKKHKRVVDPVLKFHRSYLFQALKNRDIDNASRFYLKEYIKSPYITIKRVFKYVLTRPLVLFNKATTPVVKDKFENDRKRVVIATPWLDMGGADKVVIDVANGLSTKYKTSVFITEKATNKWASRLNNKCQVVDLGKINIYKNKQFKFIKKLISNKADVLLISNSSFAYQNLPLIKKYIPNLVIVDILHGQGGVIDMGSSPEISNPYRDLIDHRVAVSKYLKKYMESVYREDETRVSVIYNGIEPVSQDKAQKNNIFGIVWVGRLSDEKKPNLAIEAFAKLDKAFRKHASLTMVGDGLLGPKLLKLSKNLNIQDNINFVGYKQNAQDYIDRANCLLITSEMEGLPLVIIEAVHSNTPVVASRVGGIPELVKDGVNGYCVEFNENAPSEFADKIKHVANWDEKQLIRCRRHNHKQSKQLTVNGMVENYINLIERLA